MMQFKYTMLLASFSLLIGTTLDAQVYGDFTCDNSVGCTPLMVNFVFNSTNGDQLNYNWDFGNGQTSNIKDPAVLYTESGKYTVKLIVNNIHNISDTIIKNAYITANKNPKASFTVTSSTEGCVPFQVSFESNSEAGDASISNYLWNFGNNNFSNGQAVGNSYKQGGSFDVSLLVTDQNNCQDLVVLENIISAFPTPVVDFSSSTSMACSDTLTVWFNPVTNLIGMPYYKWDFGDSNISNNENEYHLYQQYGLYDVKLTVTDTNYCTDSVIKPNYVVLNEVKRNISINNTEVCRNVELNIQNQSVGINQYKWDFGDGDISNETIPVKKYSSSGEYTIKLVTSFNGICHDTIINKIAVDSIKADFYPDKNFICELPIKVKYNDASVNASKWEWRFGNGLMSSMQNPEVQYVNTDETNAQFGKVYTDTLIVQSELGCADTLITDSSMRIVLPKIYFTPNDSAQYKSEVGGCTPLKINFNNFSIATDVNDTIKSYTWNFGDGIIINEVSPTHVFSELGEHTVTCSAINQSGCINSKAVHIKVGRPLEADFNHNAPSSICGSEKVEFSDNSPESSLATSWFWEFSDGNESDEQNASNVFLDTGYVSAKLTVKYNGCFNNNSIKFKDSITYVKGPAGKFGLYLDCKKPYNYKFSNGLFGAEEIYWTFGDATYDSTQVIEVEHTYKNRGTYIALLNGLNKTNNCSITVPAVINVKEVKADFNISDIIFCTSDSILLNPNISHDEYKFTHENKYYLYKWLINNEEIYTNGEAWFQLFEKGEYKVQLEIEDINGCRSMKDTLVRAYKPQAGFKVVDSVGCIPFNVDFINTSKSDTLIAKYTWDFGDNNISNEFEPHHLYTENHAFTIGLIAEDALGCQDTMVRNHSIIASRPIPQFSIGNNNIACLFDSILFQNSSKGMGIQCKWDFGDGHTSTKYNPKHEYSNTGHYDISLFMIDSLGCDTAIVFPNYLEVVGLPKANCVSNIYSAACYPALIEFNDKSQGDSIVFWRWDFGDETANAQTKNPIHTYNKPGMYNITLHVATHNGCSDTVVLENMVEILGPYASINMDDTICRDVPSLLRMTDTMNIYEFEWVMSDGEAVHDYSFYNNFKEFGSHKILLYLKGDPTNNCDKILYDSTYVPKLISQFEITDSAGCVPLMVTFQNQSLNASSYYWDYNDGANSATENPSHKYVKSGNYRSKLVASNTFGCKDSTHKHIQVYALPNIHTSADTVICVGDTASLFATGGYQYKWHPNKNMDDDLSPYPYVYPYSDQSYWVVVTDTNFCVDSSSIIVEVQQQPKSMILNTDTTIIIGDEIELLAEHEGGNYFNWIPEAYIDCNDCLSVMAKPLNNTKFVFTVTDKNNCFSISDSVQVYIDYKYSIDMPNAFSPNNDGFNDIIYVKGWGIKELLDFSVYNANNKMVFRTNMLEVGWDGTEDYKDLPQGVYYYYVRVLGFDNMQREAKGSIFLIK